MISMARFLNPLWRMRRLSRRRCLALWLAALSFDALVALRASATSTAGLRYDVDVMRSRLRVKTTTDGLSSMFGHDHLLEADAFSGQIRTTTNDIGTALVDLTVMADSLHSVDDLHPDLRWEIDTVIHEKVLQTDRYPTITFHSRRPWPTAAPALRHGRSTMIDVVGDLQLHGVSRKIELPVSIEVREDTIRAHGEVRLRQSDFGIALYTFADGNATVSDRVTLVFDLLCTRAR